MSWVNEDGAEHKAVGSGGDCREPAALKEEGFSSSRSSLIFIKAEGRPILEIRKRGGRAQEGKARSCCRALVGGGGWCRGAGATCWSMWLRLPTPRLWPSLLQSLWPMGEGQGSAPWPHFTRTAKPFVRPRRGVVRGVRGQWKHLKGVQISKYQCGKHTNET